MNIFQEKGYILQENEEYYGGTSIVRKYKKGRNYFAIKEIKNDSDYPLDKIDHEIFVMKQLQHENIIQLKEYFVFENELFQYKCLVMDWCESSLQMYVNDNPNGLSNDELFHFINDMTESLKYLMIEKNFLHRDIKLSNFLLKSTKEFPFPIVKLCDFGSTIELSQSLNESFSSTLFSAPEITNGIFSSQNDIWSLGCCFYWMSTGHCIYSNDESFSNSHQIIEIDEFNQLLQSQEPIDFDEVKQLQLQSLIKQMLVFDPNQRIDWKDFFENEYILQCQQEKNIKEGNQTQYEYICELGKGSFGSVIKSWDKYNQRYVAIKKIFRKDYDEKRLKEMAMKEIRIMKLFHHQNICAFYDYYTDTHVYVVMEFCELGDLQQLIDRRKKEGKYPLLSNDEIVSFTSDILNAIRYLHIEKHFAHRDIKPSNMLLSNSLLNKYPIIKISDLGLTKRDNYIDPLKTNTGTPAYMAPEIKNGNYTYQSDLWSIGCVLYYLSTGNLLFPKHNFRLFIKEKRLPSFSNIQTKQSIIELMKHLIVYDVNKRWNWNEIDNSTFLKECSGESINIIQTMQSSIQVPNQFQQDGFNSIEMMKKLRQMKRITSEEYISVLYTIGIVCHIDINEENLLIDSECSVNPIQTLFDCTNDIILEALRMMENNPSNNTQWKVLLQYSQSMLKILFELVSVNEQKYIDSILDLIHDSLQI